MNRLWILLVVLALPAVITAQTGNYQSPGQYKTPTAPYQPAVPAPSIINGYGGWSGYGYGGGTTTAAGSAMNGMASVISAKGDYNLSTSAAAMNMTQAQKQEIQNHQQYTDTYFAMRATNKAARQAEIGPSPTMEQLARIAREGAPKPVAADQWDPTTGKVNWPALLQQDSFASNRTELEHLLTKQATYGSLDFSDQFKARQVINSMFTDLKSQIRDVPSSDYMASREFLRSMLYATTKVDLS
jgi:hypothetical protein